MVFVGRAGERSFGGGYGMSSRRTATAPSTRSLGAPSRRTSIRWRPGGRCSPSRRAEPAPPSAGARDLQQRIGVHVTWLTRAIAEPDEAIARLSRSSPGWRETEDLLTSAPGIGDIPAHALIADLPELGQLNRRRIAALVGLAPWNRDSGRWRGRRMIGGGRAAVRRALYMPSIVAIHHNPVIRAVYRRLTAAGCAGESRRSNGTPDGLRHHYQNTR